MSGWRVWFAFEAKPAITKTSTLDLSEHYLGLRDTCRNVDGTHDVDAYLYWLDLILDHAHLWGHA